jgi:single-strand DNA-binding protein
LGADPETRVTPSGQKVTTLRIATNIRRGGKDETIWFRVTMWGDRWDKMIPYLKKGSAVMVVGRLDKPEIYNDKEGRPQISLNVTAEMVEFPPFGRQEKPAGQQAPAGNAYQEPESGYGASNYSASGQGSYQNAAAFDVDKLPF